MVHHHYYFPMICLQILVGSPRTSQREFNPPRHHLTSRLTRGVHSNDTRSQEDNYDSIQAEAFTTLICSTIVHNVKRKLKQHEIIKACHSIYFLVDARKTA